METPAKRKCVFFDRDGIVNRHPGPGYVERWEDFHLLPEFPAVLRAVQSLGYAAIIITNQRGVARGIMTVAELERIHSNLQAVLKAEHGLELLDIFYCPHNHGECDCRKPFPGMLLRAAKKHHLDLAASWIIGDDEKDVQAGHAAGCRAIFVGAATARVTPDHTVPDMPALQSQVAKFLAMG